MTWNFDANQYDPSQTASQMPVGRHPVVIRGSKLVPVKDKPQSGMLELDLEIIDGPNKGQHGTYRLNLYNENPQAAEIAHRQLSAICHVVQTYRLQAKPEGSELFNKPFVVTVEPQADPKYTQITGVLDMNGLPPTRQAGQSSAAPPSWSSGQPALAPAQPPAQPPATSWGAPAQQPPPASGAQSWQQQPVADTPSWQR